jgi:ketopantoate reductase
VAHYIYTTLSVQYKRLFELPQARNQRTRLMNGHFAVLTGIGVPVKIRAVLRSP